MQFVFGDHVLDIDWRELRRGSQRIVAEPQVLDLLIYLVENRDRLVEKGELLGAVWNGAFVTDNVLTRVITQLRKGLGDNAKSARYIEIASASQTGYFFDRSEKQTFMC